MGMFDNSLFTAPNLNVVRPDVQHFLDYKRNKDQERQRMTMDMMEFQRQQKLKDIGDTARASLNAPRPPEAPLNVLPPVGLVTPAMDAQMQMVSERNKLTDENNRMRNQIAQQNADTNREKAGNTFQLGRERLDTQENIADKNNQARSTRQDDQQEATASRDTVRNNAALERLNTRGNQIMQQIGARGEEDRKTKSTPSPNVNANNPTQKIAAEKQRANEFINTNPLGKYVSFDPNTGMVSVQQPNLNTSKWSFGNSGPTNDEYHTILGAIYGDSNSYSSTPNNPTPAPVAGQPSSDKVRVKLPDGRIGMMPRAQANQPGITILGGGQ